MMLKTDQRAESDLHGDRERTLGSPGGPRWLRITGRVVSGLLQLAILGGIAWVVQQWLATPPVQERMKPTSIVRRVEVRPLTKESVDIFAVGYGTVVADREVQLAAEVSGRITRVQSPLEPGQVLAAGAFLCEIDPADYDLAIQEARAELDQARADYEIERGRKEIAEREWSLFGESLGSDATAAKEAAVRRALREPQLARAEAVVGVAESRVKMAELERQRCEIRVPFDAVIVTESIEVGRIVREGDILAHLVGTERFRVQATVPTTALEGLRTALGREIRLRRTLGLSGEHQSAGRLERILPDLTEEGRMGRILVSVEDPLALRDPAGLPLSLGSYVRVDVPAGRLEQVLRVPRAALRENDRIFVLDREQRLRIRPLEVRWRGEEEIFGRAEVQAGDRLITSWLPEVLPGTELAANEGTNEAGDSR